MAKESKNSENLNFGELGTIRDILMGQHIKSFNSRFEEFEKKLELLKKEFRDGQKSFEDKTIEKFSDLEVKFKTDLEKVEKSLSEKSKELLETIEKTNKGSNYEIGRMLMELGEKLMK